MGEDRLFKLINSLIRGNRLNRHIPVIGFDFLYSLKFMRQTDEPRFVPQMSVTQKRQAFVVKTTAHTEAVAGAIECHEWHEDKIEVLCARALLRTYSRFKNTQAVINQRCVGVIRSEPEPVMAQARQNG